jgi:hypothetical protein
VFHEKDIDPQVDSALEAGTLRIEEVNRLTSDFQHIALQETEDDGPE